MRTACIGFLALMVAAACTTSAQASLVHDWELNGSLADALGGPSLTPFAWGGVGTVGATAYDGSVGFSFGERQGLDVSGLGLNPTGPYSIETRFFFTNFTGGPSYESGWVKIIDFNHGFPDYGLYTVNGKVDFYPAAGNSSVVLSPNQFATLLLTRSAAGQVDVYVDGILQFSFADTVGYSVLSSTESVSFFKDDGYTTVENAPGFVDYIRISDSVVVPGSTPLPAALPLFTPASAD
jgi:hypothetical protein